MAKTNTKTTVTFTPDVKPTKQSRLLSSLKNGVDFSAKQIASRYNTSMAGAYDLVRQLRNKGHDIMLKDVVTSTGEVMSVYAMAQPKRRSRRAA